jgi:hypothetical protein
MERSTSICIVCWQAESFQVTDVFGGGAGLGDRERRLVPGQSDNWSWPSRAVEGRDRLCRTVVNEIPVSNAFTSELVQNQTGWISARQFVGIRPK